jgi:hypothetical protein
VAWLAKLPLLDPEEDRELPEPPVPPGLGKLSAPQKALAEFLRLEDDLLEAARAGAGPSRDELAEWVAAQPPARKDAWLVAVAENDVPSPRLEIQGEFRKAWAARRAPAGRASGRTVGELLERWEHAEEERKRREAEERRRKQERAAREKAEARARHLDALAGHDAELWRKAEEAIATKTAIEYDRAVELLLDLRDLAERGGRQDDFRARLGRLREAHRNKRTFLQRLDRHGLGG